MPITHFPHGVGTDYDFIIPVTFGNVSVAQQISVYTPVALTVLSAVAFRDTSARVASVAITTGSVGTGTDIVSSVSFGSGGANTTQELTLASTTVAAGEYLQFTRAAQGSVGATTINLVAKRAS